jgi:hypothetical protein
MMLPVKPPASAAFLKSAAVSAPPGTSAMKITMAKATAPRSSSRPHSLAGQSGHAGQGAVWIAGDFLSTKVNSSLTRRR